MGEIADAMISGEMCERCGGWLPCILADEGETCADFGIPAYCSMGCAKARGAKGSQVCPH